MDINNLLNPYFLIGLAFLLLGVFSLRRYLKGWGIYWLQIDWYWKRFIKPSKASQSDKTWLLMESLILIVIGIILITRSRAI